MQPNGASSSASRFIRAVIDGAGPVLHSIVGSGRTTKGVIVCLAGLGTTKERLANHGRVQQFEEAGFAVILADHYNEGERRDPDSEAKSNRAGWSKNQKATFWKAIHLTASESVPQLVTFAASTFATSHVFAYGASMGGDIFLASLIGEHRLRAVVCERSTPDWLRPESTANVLGESREGDALYEAHCPCNNIDAYVGHATRLLFLCGESDTHVPKASAESFVANLQTRAAHQSEVGRHRVPQLVVLPSGGWEGHILKDAAMATRLSLEFYAEALSEATPVGRVDPDGLATPTESGAPIKGTKAIQLRAGGPESKPDDAVSAAVTIF